MRDDVKKLQAFMVESAAGAFSEAELADLRVLVRLVVEFQDEAKPGELDEDERLRYRIESIFSGVSSFCSVAAAYRMLSGTSESTIDWATIRLETLTDHIHSAFARFVGEQRFEVKCQLLLDLFRLQLVFAGMRYD
jgi:hypothetical protein